MGIIVDGIKQAFLLLIHGDKQMLQIAWLSLVVSVTVTAYTDFSGATTPTFDTMSLA